MEHFDYVIVLCPSERKTSSNGKSRFFDEVNLDEPRGQELYLGGQIRMEAVADVAPYVDTFVVVGGCHKKVTDMKEFLVEEFEKEFSKDKASPKVIRIESDADTTGNLWAISKWLEQYNIEFLGKNVGILTNFYHMLRAMRFAADILPQYRFVPLTAEALLNRHQPTYSFYSESLLLRLCSEIDGLRDWENRRYKKQQDSEKSWKSICHDIELLKFLDKKVAKIG